MSGDAKIEIILYIMVTPRGLSSTVKGTVQINTRLPLAWRNIL